MHNDWEAFLRDNGAQIEDGRVSDFGDPAGETAATADGDILCDLSHRGLIRASGADAEKFLHGQTTNDVRQVTAAHAQLNGLCSPKGRMLASFRLFQRDGDYYLELPRELVEPIRTRLAKYMLMAKVKLEEASDLLARFGLSGPGAAARLQAAWGVLPAEADEVTSRDGVTVIRVAGAQARFEVHGAPELLRDLWQALRPHTRPVGADGWGLLDLRAGIPTVYAATVEAFVPQMVNLQRVGGVSFRKGCYPGQEVVARMQYLGHLKRRMYLAHVATAERPAPGAELFSPQSESGQGAGRVVDARPAPGGGFDLLAVVQIECAEGGTVHLERADGPPLAFRDLPYRLEQDDIAQAGAL